jgi:hypothetical protein
VHGIIEMNLENSKPDTKTTYCVTPFTQNDHNRQITEIESRLLVAMAEGNGN